jgi:organic radical activating enzyme
MYRYRVISLHFTTDCNLHCPFCYQQKKQFLHPKPSTFFIALIPYLTKLTPQIALGGGEPLTQPRMIQKIAQKAQEVGLMVNFTTNGKLFMAMSDQEIYKILQNITMISISYDAFKWDEFSEELKHLIIRIKTVMGEQNKENLNLNSESKKLITHEEFQIGCNLLLDSLLLKNNGKKLIKTLDWLINEVHFDRVFVLYPKNTTFLPILPLKSLFDILTMMYSNLYVDDLIKQIFEQNSYQNWTNPCHYGQDLISIDVEGGVSGCSFDPVPMIYLNHPSDILTLKFDFADRFQCPYLPLLNETIG